MNIFSGLLFLHGHVASAELARQLPPRAPPPPPPPFRPGRGPPTPPTGQPAAAGRCPARP